MSSVFPLEIFERIIDLSMDDEERPRGAKHAMLKWSRVCHAWRRQCLPVALRTQRFDWPRLDTLYSFRQQALLWPHLASLVEEVEVLPRPGPYGSQIEMMPIVVYPHLPRLQRVMIQNSVVGRTYPHRYFRISRLRFDSVAELTLDGFQLRDTSELDAHLSMFPQIRTLCLRNVWWRPQAHKAWPRAPKLVPPITHLELAREGLKLNQWAQSRDRVGLEAFLHSVGRTLTTLALNLPAVRSLTAHESVPFEVEKFDLPHLSHLRLTMSCVRSIRTELSGEPYRDHLMDIPKLIMRIQAYDLRTLWLSFWIEYIQPDPEAFLHDLRPLVAPVESLMATCNPRLRTITFDVGSLQDTVAWWTAELQAVFAPLFELYAVEIQVPARRLNRWGKLV